ncbi:MAG: hypothetical protein DRO39_03970 [Thermoprotei archaeon]|nr:MAG: hypothetical protein DRO39_03970 [Thermoprotei archaeon]
MRPPLIDLSLGMELYATETRPVNSATLPHSERSFVVYELYEDYRAAPPYEPIGSCSPRARWLAYAVRKHRISTIQAARTLSSVFRCQLYSFSGLKEAWGVTHQLIFFSECANPHPYVCLKRLEAVFLGCVPRPLRSSGNEFRIELRVSGSDTERLLDNVRTVRSVAIPNYYGYQRFGYVRPISHAVGKALVLKNWDDALIHILGRPYPYENPLAIQARRLCEAGNFCEATRLFRGAGLELEYTVSRRLCRGSDTLNALQALGKDVLMLYVNAFQSYLFNRILSRLWVLGSVKGRVPVPGHGLRVSNDLISKIVREVLDMESVNPSDFRLEKLGVKARYWYREPFMVVKPEIKCVHQVSKESACTLSFILRRGSYATVVLRELLKTDIPRLWIASMERASSCHVETA